MVLADFRSVCRCPENSKIESCTSGIMLFALYFFVQKLFLWLWPPLDAPKGSIPLVQEDDLLLSGRRFLTARWDFYKQWSQIHRYFRFRLGNKDILAVSGHAARKWFLEDQEMSLVHGYTLLVGHESAWKVAGLSYEEGSLPRLRKVFRGENLKARKLQVSIYAEAC